MGSMLNKLKSSLRTGLGGEFLRYVLVGALSFGVDYGTILLLNKLLRVNYLLAAVIGFVLGLICNYIGSTRFVFKNRSVRNRRVEWIAFAVIGVLGLLLNEGMLFLLTGKLSIDVTYSKPMTQLVVFFWNFAARKVLLFTDKSSVKEAAKP